MEMSLSQSYNNNFGHNKNKVVKYFRPLNWYKKPNIPTSQEEIDRFFLEIQKAKSEFNLSKNNAKVLNPKLQRVLDIILASVLAVPAFIVTVIASSIVKISQKDMPAFHKQKRYGFEDKIINIYKIRTVEKTDDGWRKTSKFAHLLRKYSIDEFPQIWNVFKGEMSFMGPRPLIFKDLKLLLQEGGMEFLLNRLSVKPGFGFGYQKGRTLPKLQTELEKDFFKDMSFKTYLKTIKSLFFTVIRGNNL